jgi:dipeptidyl aminopeptidase/acylaminoacyl peptidase
MNRHDGLERELTAWMADVATPSIPDYTNDIVRLTAGLRQRPRWAFAERWLPMSVDTLHRVPAPSMPWRTIALLAVIALLAGALVMATVGSAPRRPAPFGLAVNGLIAFDQGGISTIDPVTGEQVGLVTGPNVAHDPRWSLDGSRVAFIREVDGASEEIVIVDADGGDPRIVISQALNDVDPDGLEWAPDGLSLLVVHTMGVRQLGLMDTEDGHVTNLPILQYATLEAFFRPPDGREVVFMSGSESDPGVSIVTLAGLAVREVPLALGPGGNRRAMGWTPDGSRLLIHGASPADRVERTYVVDPVSGGAVELDVAYGHVSNDGRWVAGLTTGDQDTTCVVSIEGGPCRIVGDVTTAPWGPTGKGLQWSPDDEWLVIERGGTGRTLLLDPDGGGEQMPTYLPAAIESWQRTAD